MTSSNPAALQGWTKSVDPNSGRVFYANHITRKTQWEEPEGWMEEVIQSSSSNMNQKASRDDEDDNEPLPSNWEIMRDPTTGKPFYVDHQRKITTWTRPRPEKPDNSMYLRPATATSPTSGNTTTLNRILQQHQQNTISARRSYQQEAAYYQTVTSHSTDVDFSDSLPKLDFTVKKVSDSLRPSCPGCGKVFAMTIRRHHCRLCGDVYCDSCSNHRCTLPLEGPEFDKPVRVCDFCFKDVDVGNFFSTRRYLTVLHLYEPNTTIKRDDDAGVATEGNVNAALSAFCQDLQQMVQAGDASLHEKITIPPEILLPEILKHLKQRETAERAICCVAALLALETLAGDQNADFTTAIYLYGKKAAIDDILKILERDGKDRRLLYVQEQAARTLYYLTESRIIAATTRKLSELEGEDDNKYGNTDECLDILRSMRILLDHASVTQNPNLQRWVVACLRNLVVEDERRSTMAVNNVAALVASESSLRNIKLDYESCMDELVNSGGLMILGSLIGSDDADIRAHAVSTLNATLTSTRAVDASMVALSEMTGGEFGSVVSKEGDIIRAIVAGGGCGASVTPLLLSAETNVAGMGCSLLSSLVLPLLSDPAASASLSSKYDYRSDQKTSIGACREASVEIATGSCLPALLSLVREQGATRPLELRAIAMTALAAVISSIGEMGRSWAQGAYEEGLERMGAPNKLKDAILMLNEEECIDVALQILLSGSGQSLGSSKDTPTARIRESAGIVLGALTSCSAEAIMTIQSKNVLTSLIQASMDASMITPSSLRVDGAPRCQGVLDAVASVLMFSWQHSSGADNDLLDKLIEMIDAGAIPYASRVLNNKLDWDSRDKSVGAMRGRTASCKLLACLFGIALTNDNNIGMRRLMDAVESDARSYRGSSDGKQSLPSNIIEATLSCLQTASTQARKVVIGGTHHGHHYQTALLDLLEASLLAVGSLCGSSIAPGGSEGTLVTGENCLVSRNDTYVGRRKEICNVACDIVVRGGRSGPTLLPTMIVGGFGEGAVLASLRLALAVAQNGNSDQHAKLAHSGILVPISDILKSALSNGDIYKFSSSLTLVRLCGPYIAAGHGGGLESVRDAIRVATNVLTLPVNPESTLKQMETQEALKSECIVALEALSRNASLWSAISSEALPSMVRYLHMSAHISGSRNPRSQKTKAGALRAILQIVHVPSHAIAAAESNIVDPLCKLLSVDGSISQDVEIPVLALEILQVIAKSPEARRKARLLDADTIRGLCSIVAKAVTSTDEASQPMDNRSNITFIGLEVLQLLRSEIEKSAPTTDFLQSEEAHIFLAAIVSEPKFVRALCATILTTTNMRIQRHDTDASDDFYDIQNIYGNPLINVKEKCGGYSDTHIAAESLLFNVCVYACASGSPYGETFWEIFQLQDLYGDYGAEECVKTSASLVAHFLQLMHTDHTPFFPTDANRLDDFTSITRPLVRHRLLEALTFSVNELAGERVYGQTTDPYVTSILVHFQVPQVCLALWKDPALLDLAFDLIKSIVGSDADEVIHLFVDEKSALLSLFDLLNLDDSSALTANVTDIRRFLASVLGQLAESGLLKSAVERFDVKSGAIAALAAACLSEEGRVGTVDEDEDITANRLSTVLMQCLVDLCSVKDDTNDLGRIRLSQVEALAIATNLGKKLCHMVLSRFLERSKLESYDMDEEEDTITRAPDVAMLCAIAQHHEALLTLRAIGGLHALSLIAAEGEVSALIALRKACTNDASILLEGDTYQSVMKLVSSIHTKESKLETAALDLLAQLCTGSVAGRVAVSSHEYLTGCTTRAMDVITSLVTVNASHSATDAPSNAVVDLDQDNEIVDKEESESQSSSGEVDQDERTDTDTPPPNIEIAIQEVEEDVADLACASFAFLTSLVSTKATRSVLISNPIGVDALLLLVRSSPIISVKYACLQLIMSLAPQVSDGTSLTSSLIVDVAKGILSSSVPIKSTSNLNSNRFHCAVVDAIAIVFDTIGESEQRDVSKLCAKLFIKNVNSCIVTKATTKDEDRLHSAELMYSLTHFMLLMRGRSFANDVFKKEEVAAMINLVLWKMDPKSTIGTTNPQYWDGSVANCLILVSGLFSRPEECLKKAGLNLKSIVSVPLMLARPGKAPRKSIDFRSALDILAAGADTSAAISATRILKYITDCE